jgi:hypothetical protein
MIDTCLCFSTLIGTGTPGNLPLLLLTPERLLALRLRLRLRPFRSLNEFT